MIYFLPGYIFLIIKAHMLSYGENKNNFFILKSIVVSYILNNLYIFTWNLVPRNNILIDNLISSPKHTIFLLLFSFVCGVIISLVLLSEWWLDLIQNIGINKTNYSNIWDDITNNNEGVYIRIYFDDKQIMYGGSLRVYEDIKGKENYFIGISNYKKFDMSGNSVDKLCDYYEDDYKWAVFNTNKIDRYELFYEKDDIDGDED